MPLMNILGLIPKSANIQPLSEQHRHKILIFIPKSTSKNMPLVANMMSQADEFEVIKIGNKEVYASGFELSLENITLVSAISEMASGWKGFSIFFNQQPLGYDGWFWHTLHCYKRALQCKDPKAHCNIIEKPRFKDKLNLVIKIQVEPSNEQKEPVHYKNYLIPCRQLNGASNRLDEQHPSSPQNQLHAMAVEKNCHWCPFFNADDYREIEMVDEGE